MRNLSSAIVALLLVSGCVLQNANKAQEMKVGDKTYFFATAVGNASCVESVTSYLFDAEKLLDAARAQGPNLACAIMTGAGAAAVGGGLGIIAARELRPDQSVNVSQSGAAASSTAVANPVVNNSNNLRNNAVQINQPPVPPGGM
jgi:hypothetical protein